jgi:hypothetical protein
MAGRPAAPRRWVERVAPIVPRRVMRWVRRAPELDPFRTLEVQLSLTRLQNEIAVLQAAHEPVFARAHHLHAAITAYDRALDDACGLAQVSPADAGGPVRRLLAEAELHTRGWRW